MTDLRTAAQQALERLRKYHHGNGFVEDADCIAALEAALAQQKDPTDPGRDVDVLREHVRHLERRVRELHAQQAEPVQEPVAWWKRHRDGSVELNDARTFIAEDAIAAGRRPLIFGDTSPPQRPAESVPEPYTDDVTRLMRDAGMTFHLGLPHKAVVEQMTRVVDLVYAEASIKAAQQFSAALAQQAKPVWMHPWPPVRAQQAEPVSADPHTTTLRNLLKCCLSWEPDVCVLGNVTARQAITALRAALAQQDEPAQEPVAGRAFLERILTAMEGVIDVADRKTDEFDALRSCVIDLTLMLHTAPPQRKLVPLTEAEIEHIGITHQSLRQVARAVERAVWEKNNG